MSRLNALIEEYCPNGVEFVQLGTVLDYEQPTKYIVNDTNYDENFETPVLTAGQTFILGYTNETVGIYNATKENPTIIFDDFTTSFHWVDFNFKIKSSAMKMLRIKPEKVEVVLFRYVYHCIKNIKYEPVDHSRQWIAKYSNFKIPLPPLPVQEKIVQILDNFTELTAKLTAELTARKQQYEYYRDSLLTFGYEVERQPLWNVTIWDKKFNAVEREKQKIVITYPYLLASDLFKLEQPNGDVFLLSTGEQTGWTNEDLAGENLCVGEVVTIPWGKSRPVKEVMKYYSGKFVTADNRIATSSDKKVLNNKFLYYWLQCNGEVIDKYYRGSGIKHPSMYDVLNMQIPLPKIEQQERIVEILDHFDTLCNDVSAGLPAEIKAREEQYEYYRNKLLTFNEKGA